MKAGYSPNLEGDLIRLLSILDSSRNRLEQIPPQKGAILVLKQLHFMVNAIIGVADQHITAKVVSRDANGALKKIIEFYAIYRSLLPDSPSLHFMALFHKEKLAFQGDVYQDLFCRCVNLFQDIVQSYFSLFTQRFESSLKARDWVEVAAGFLVELKQTTRTMQATAIA
jgi:hypothetical protein